jgi:hypothetical protein
MSALPPIATGKAARRPSLSAILVLGLRSRNLIRQYPNANPGGVVIPMVAYLALEPAIVAEQQHGG